MSKRDENDRLRDGTLPADIEDDVTPMRADTLARKTTLTLVQAGVDERELPLPSDVHAEASLLAILLWHGAYAPGKVTLATVGDILEQPEAFYAPAHRAIWTALVTLHAAKTSPDPVAVNSELVRLGFAHATGGIEYLEQLVSTVQAATDAKLRTYARSIREAWIRRTLIEAGRKMEAAARAGGERALAIAENAQRYVTDIANAASEDTGSVRLATSLAVVIRRLMEDDKRSVSTGFRDLDEAIGGLFEKETTVVGARSGVGKTTIASQVAGAIGSSASEAALYFSLEMPHDKFTERYLAQAAGVDMTRLRDRTLTREQMGRLFDEANKLKESHLYFSDAQTQTMAMIHALTGRKAAQLARHGVRLALVVIDHIGLVKPSQAMMRASREEKVAEFSRGLGWIATSFNLHVMALAQVSREYVKGKDGNSMPQPHHLRESGALEQDADNIWMLDRKFDEYGLPVAGSPARLGVAKSRYGKKAFVRLSCDVEAQRFGNYEGV